ncbi:MAG: peptide deformylase [Lentisphaerae bacterium GWF2_57_35]|nr:MAG: peptide deformylase [Lentisphaerae bacterium GWF2_57_35]
MFEKLARPRYSVLVKLNIRTYGDPVLREKSTQIVKITKEIRALADDMIETMHAAKGVGLAAQQVGRTEAIAVLDVPASYDVDEAGNRLHPDIPMPWALLNPEITEMSEESEACEEGCLSFPDISAPIPRAKEITLKYMDIKGAQQSIHLKEFMARAVQHELDHLNGVLFVDRMSPLKKIAIAGQLKRLRRETQEVLQATT